MRLRIASVFVLPLFSIGLGVAAASDGQSNRPDVIAALKTIRQDADAVASGRFSGKSALQAPARDVALQWSKIEPVLAGDGNVLVETKMANAAVTAFEKDWQTKRDVRGEAKDLSSSMADLVDAEKPKS